MEVAFATPWDSKCAIAKYSYSLIEELKQRVEIELVSLDPGSVLSSRRLAARLSVGDIAHIQHDYSFFGGTAVHRNWFRRLAGRIAVPLVVTIHEMDLGDWDALPLRLYKRWFNQFLFTTEQIDRIIVHSSAYRELLAELGVDRDRLRVIPIGVPTVPPGVVSSEEAKSALGVRGRRVITVFGSVVRRKGYEHAIDALAQLPADVVLVIAGGPHPDDRTGFFDELTNWIENEGLAGRVVVTGYLTDDHVPVVMAATDVALAPSTSLSSSSSLMHCVAYGRPIVASDLPQNREINERQPCLSLFSPGDPSSLAVKVYELLEYESKREQAAAAVQSYARVWNVRNSAEQTTAVYEEVLHS